MPPATIKLYRDFWGGFSDYKKFDRKSPSGFCALFYVYATSLYPNFDTIHTVCGNLDYKMGVLFAKWDFWLQNQKFIFKTRFSPYKRDFRVSIHLRNALPIDIL